jgi:myo-inositol-1(or 4)-monophosphatase
VGSVPACWLVDPLDGTTNFMHQLPSYCVSVALAMQGRVVVGVVIDPLLEFTFFATAGGGAWWNGQPIRASRCRRLSDALVAASLPPGVQRDDPALAQFVEVLLQAQALRRLGSCAMNLSYVASGRLDAYWATRVRPWDVAAGSLLVAEAGGTIRHIDGGDFDIADPRFVAAASPELVDELRRVILG